MKLPLPFRILAKVRYPLAGSGASHCLITINARFLASREKVLAHFRDPALRDVAQFASVDATFGTFSLWGKNLDASAADHLAAKGCALVPPAPFTTRNLMPSVLELSYGYMVANDEAFMVRSAAPGLNRGIETVVIPYCYVDQFLSAARPASEVAA